MCTRTPPYNTENSVPRRLPCYPPGSIRLRLDQLGKNVFRDFFVLLASAETEAEVPPGDAQKIDIWFVPDPARLGAFADPLPALLAEMVTEPAMVELFSGTIDKPTFHACVRKRYQWHRILELRDKRPWALPWLVRLEFEVPADLSELPAEERDLIMETREWFEPYQRQIEDRGQLRVIARQMGKRLGRPLTEAERAMLAERLDRLGGERIDDVILSFPTDALAAWLADPSAT